MPVNDETRVGTWLRSGTRWNCGCGEGYETRRSPAAERCDECDHARPPMEQRPKAPAPKVGTWTSDAQLTWFCGCPDGVRCQGYAAHSCARCVYTRPPNAPKPVDLAAAGIERGAIATQLAGISDAWLADIAATAPMYKPNFVATYDGRDGLGPLRATRAQIDAEVARRAAAKVPALTLADVPEAFRRRSLDDDMARTPTPAAVKAAAEAGWKRASYVESGTYSFTAPDGRAVTATRAELAASLPLLLGDVPEAYRRHVVADSFGAASARLVAAGWRWRYRDGDGYVIVAPDNREVAATGDEIRASLPAARAFELVDVTPEQCLSRLAWLAAGAVGDAPCYSPLPWAAEFLRGDRTRIRVERSDARGDVAVFTTDEVRAFLAARDAAPQYLPYVAEELRGVPSFTLAAARDHRSRATLVYIGEWVTAAHPTDATLVLVGLSKDAFVAVPRADVAAELERRALASPLQVAGMDDVVIDHACRARPREEVTITHGRGEARAACVVRRNAGDKIRVEAADGRATEWLPRGRYLAEWAVRTKRPAPADATTGAEVLGQTATGQSTTEATVANESGESILDTFLADAGAGAMRGIGSQFSRLARDNAAAVLSRNLADDDPAFRARVAAWLKTDAGTAAFDAFLAAGLTAVPGDPAFLASLAREMRQRAAGQATDLVLEIVMGPLREVMAGALKGTAPLAAKPEALSEPARAAFSVVGDAAKVGAAK